MNHSTSKGIDVYCYASRHTMKYFTKIFSIMLFLVFTIQLNTSAQGSHPSCNISGPLEAVISAGDIIINVEVAFSTATPTLQYSLSGDATGAFIKAKGPLVYNAAKNTATQQLTISPGNTGSGFNLKLKATTPHGVSTCSKSVSLSH